MRTDFKIKSANNMAHFAKFVSDKELLNAYKYHLIYTKKGNVSMKECTIWVYCKNLELVADNKKRDPIPMQER